MFNKIKSYFTTDKPLVKSEGDYLMELIQIKNQQLQELEDERQALEMDKVRLADQINILRRENAVLAELLGGKS